MLKPTTLDHILARFIVPYYGERAAKKVAFYKAHSEGFIEKYGHGRTRFNTYAEICCLRFYGYVLIPAAVGLVGITAKFGIEVLVEKLAQ